MTVSLATAHYFERRVGPIAILATRQAGYAPDLNGVWCLVDKLITCRRTTCGMWVGATFCFFRSHMSVEIMLASGVEYRVVQYCEFDYHDPGFPESAIAMILGNCGKRFVPRSAV